MGASILVFHKIIWTCHGPPPHAQTLQEFNTNSHVCLLKRYMSNIGVKLTHPRWSAEELRKVRWGAGDGSGAVAAESFGALYPMSKDRLCVVWNMVCLVDALGHCANKHWKGANNKELMRLGNVCRSISKICYYVLVHQYIMWGWHKESVGIRKDRLGYSFSTMLVCN